MIFSFSDLSIFGPVLTRPALLKQAQTVRRIFIEIERGGREMSEEALKWKDHKEVLALYGFKIAMLLRKQGSNASLAFFATRLPKQSDFEVPEWMI